MDEGTIAYRTGRQVSIAIILVHTMVAGPFRPFIQFQTLGIL